MLNMGTFLKSKKEKEDYHFPGDWGKWEVQEKMPLTLKENLNEEVIGAKKGFWGPFGWRKYTYCDHTASGKAVKCIENFISKQVLPHYANTHTTVSHTAFQTTTFRSEARTILRESVGAGPHDKLIFCGAGATSAVHKLVHFTSYPKSRKVIVFVGPYEHHSNILPWREAASKVIQVPLTSSGQVDISFLVENLQRLADKKNKNQLIIGCFSAGSNVTGAVTNDIEITQLLHKFGALAFWDYAAAAPHVDIQMNPKTNDDNCPSASKDAIFFSGHKFLGGPQTPGVLVVKRHVMQNPVPQGVGGGTVLFTTRKRHHYLEESEEREEGGTPNILGSIRLGLVFRLRNLVGVHNILETEAAFCRQVLEEWRGIPEIVILGDQMNPRLPIISFMIKHLESGYFLHHNFVVALLNDLFGIQCRGGCMCAGPYSQDLLGIFDQTADSYEEALKNKEGMKIGTLLKPGFVRISLNFHSNQKEVHFVAEAVKQIAHWGWKLLPFYKMDWDKGSFMFNGNCKPNKLASLALFDQNFTSSSKHVEIPPPEGSNTSPMEEYLLQSKLLLTTLLLYPFLPPQDVAFLNLLKVHKSLRKLRWFMISSEAVSFQNQGYVPDSLKSPKPFEPVTFWSNDLGSDKLFQRPGSIPNQIWSSWRKYDRIPREQRRGSFGGGRRLSCEFYPEMLKSGGTFSRRGSHDSGFGFEEDDIVNFE